MRAALTALADELKRLKSAGVKSVVVSEETLAHLRRAVKTRANKSASEGLPSDAIPSRVAGAATSLSSPTPIKQNAVKESPPPPSIPSVVTYEAPTPAFTYKPLVPENAVAIPAPPTVKLPSGGKQERWDALLNLVTNDPVCKMHVRPGKKIVLGVGNVDAKIFF